jgi:predicted RNase H-like nuclease
MKFLGIDFGWISGASGLCCLEWKDSRLHLLNLQRMGELDQVLAWIDAWASDSEAAMVAVDAPTLIPNATGMRLPDRLAHKYFGKYHAGCYPANQASSFASRTVEFGLSLEARGFQHAPRIIAQHLGRYQIESFPHPAIVHLFGLDRILKYKKGVLAERRVELARLRSLICDRLPLLEPSLDIDHSKLPKIPVTGTALKAVEDQLDSIICAYIGAHWWYWGLERNLVLGDGAEGYIVVPQPHQPLNG